MPKPNQLHVLKEDLVVSEQELIALPEGTVTEDGIRKNINVGILYIEAWLRGHGAVALYNLMEDAATAEISRTQVWHWLKNKVKLDDGRYFTKSLYLEIFDDEIEKIIRQTEINNFTENKFKLATGLFNQLVISDHFEEFLTLEAYKHI
jgi:malate synthase